MQIRTLLACSMLAALASACAHPQPQPQPQPAPPAPSEPEATSPPPKLVVLVVVDQLPSWWFEARRQHFPRGTARLIREGVYYPKAEYPYAVTFTAAGHAALGTGAPPSVTGIADNERWDPEAKNDDGGLGDRVPAAKDDASPVFDMSGNGTQTRPQTSGRSGKALLVEGVADVLRDEKPGAKSVAISIKDRSAVFVAGREPDLALWYDENQSAMTTSEFYLPPSSKEHAETMAWLLPLADKTHMKKYTDFEWERLPGLAHEAITGSVDRQPGETKPELKPGQAPDSGQLDDAFPHQSSAKHVAATPAGDSLLFNTAFEAIRSMSLGADDVPDYLAISFSAQDIAGHYWGPDSWERLDIFVRFDQELEEFLVKLDQRIGAGGYALVLTSDHGSTRLKEFSKARGDEAHRIQRTDIEKAAEQAASKAMEGTKPANRDWIAYVGDNSLYLTPGLDEQTRARVLDAMVAAIKNMDGMAEAEKREDIEGNCEQRTGFKRLACYSVVPRDQDPGDIYFAAKPRSIITAFSLGTNHGSPNPDDRQVPIIVYAPGSPTWGSPRTVDKTVSPLQVAPTLAALLGISAPPAATEKPLP